MPRDNLPTLVSAERRRLDVLPDDTRAAALELMSTIERGRERPGLAGKWSKLLTAIERLEDRQRSVA
jgi:hypothetical protein